VTPAQIRALSAKGYTTDQIAEIAECIDFEEREKAAAHRKANRIANRAYRERKAKQKQQVRDVRDHHAITRSLKSLDNPNGSDVGTTNAQESLLLTESESKKERLLLKWNFELFWKAYPRRVAKKAAEKAFRKVEREGEISFDGLLAAVRRIKAREAQFIPYPATWLNAGQYLDEAAMSNGGSYATHWKATHDGLEERLRRGWG
jgi:hypothetical protein